MKIHVSQELGCYGEDLPYRMWKKFNSDIIPHKGDFIKDPVWDSPEEYKVIETIIDYNNDICYVLVCEIAEDIEDIDHFIKTCAKPHGWTPYR